LQSKQTNQLLEELDAQVEKQRRANAKRIDEYRREMQKKEDRRDFDLYDPERLRKDPPLRVNDEDPTLGVASLKRFEGEDLSQKERLKLQKEQMRLWVQEQMYEKEQLNRRIEEEQR
jgi:phytoene dehydrogenase-like protein